ncbi:tRNA(m5U54)methyltransferase [Tulasnella sp. 403]|nr:tRNA(m5U54)methyltransferase [Tulasnella sp. 403]
MDTNTESTTTAPRPRSTTPPTNQPSKRPRLDDPSAVTDSPIPSTSMEGVQIASSSSKPSSNPKGKKKKIRRPPPPESGSSEDVILKDVMALIGNEAVELATTNRTDYTSPLVKGQEMELVVSELSSNGEALCLVPPDVSPSPWVVLVPFALPDEVVRVRIYANARFHSLADLVEVLKPNESLRDNSRIKCRYFGVCAGCQYQMLSYETQLELKKRVVEKAYQNFFGLDQALVPQVLPTIGSPKTYGYRTKITPHFDLPPTMRKAKGGQASHDPEAQADVTVNIGFGEKGRRRVIDIEECVIATPVINEALPTIREQVKRNLRNYKRGATLLLRDSFSKAEPAPSQPQSRSVEPSSSAESSHVATTTPASNLLDEVHTCVTDHHASVRERVGDVTFEFPAGSFFQNNNSVLEPLVAYVRAAIFSHVSDNPPTHLVDTYCGAGFFALSLARDFVHVAGVEISADSIASARHNATLNNLPLMDSPGGTVPSSPSSAKGRTSSVSFMTGKSEAIFESVGHFPAQDTVIIIDPPRKGCDGEFLSQVVAFHPRILVYVSCNVHTQARDLATLLRLVDSHKSDDADAARWRYEITSVRGFDLFPQTSHVESVAVLRLTIG